MARLIPLLLCLLLGVVPASAETYTIEGRRLTIEPPEGYCLLDPNVPGEKRVTKMYKAILAEKNLMLQLFMDCDELANARDSSVRFSDRYGMITLPLRDGGILEIELSRADYLDAIAEMMARMPVAAARMDEDFDKRIANIVPYAVDGNTQVMGVMARDDEALYSGLLHNPAGDGSDSLNAGLIGLTVVKGLPIALNLFRPFVDASTYRGLYEDSRAIIAELIARN